MLIAMNKMDAQNQSSLKPQMFQIDFDDDFFNYRLRGTDKYYTAGLAFIGYFKRRRGGKFVKNKNVGYDNLYFISLNQIMNTPNEISRKGFQAGDYPYAGLLYGTYGKIHSGSNSRLTQALSVGMLGPKAFAGKTQIWVHSVINYTEPKGWDSQINGELVISYMARHEKAVLAPGGSLDIIAGAEVNAGTIFANASAGFILRAGKLNSWFSTYKVVKLGDDKVNKNSVYFFLNPSITAVGYNAALQGGLSGKLLHTSKNQYRIPGEDINRLLGRLIFGISYVGKNIAASFSQVIQSAEFSTVNHHEYGNITLSFRI